MAAAPLSAREFQTNEFELVGAESDAAEQSQAPSRRYAAVGILGLLLCAGLAFASWSGRPSEANNSGAMPLLASGSPADHADEMSAMRDDDLVHLSDADEKKSLFDRLGGSYAIATVVDKFIDVIMVDDDLNANERVKEAHHKVKPAGFKYLVWEIVNQATGGPAKYTGRDMKTAHWHLKITSSQWNKFAGDFKKVLDEFKVPEKEQTELFNIVGPLKKDVVNESPDHVDAPKPADADADPKTLYKKLGGIYAIATVVDHFIDVIMTDPDLNENAKVKEAHHKVAPAGFKVLVTQFVAQAFGGPQVYTGRDMKAAHKGLGITSKEWERFAKLFGESLDKFHVPADLQKDIFDLVGPLKKDIVEL
eukprot:TRINITY_DN5397_c0_g1_i1.p1 TRINITY_DN5397_c0_g1~~TRINITY_DN5397_c0_g1_i1.p1  ORF type:complete len:364 (+),score=98.73 TRINITY_DN5397_c0_g1_i1:136-1227(+)